MNCTIRDSDKCSRHAGASGLVRIFLVWYTPDGYADEVFHIHLRNKGDADEIYFCRYLKEHPETAREYEALKLELLKKYGRDRDGYTAAKTSFVKRITAIAKSQPFR